MFVDFDNQEINLGVSYLSTSLRAMELATHLHERVSASAPSVSHLVNPWADSALAQFDFVPKDLGTIRGFHVRVHVAALGSWPHASAQAREIALGHDDVVIIVVDDGQPDAAALWGAASGLIRQEALDPPKAVVVLAEAFTGSSSDEALKSGLPPSTAILRAGPLGNEGAFPSIKAALRSGLTAMQQSSPEAESRLVPLPAVSWRALLTMLEVQRERPLTEEEVLDARDRMPCIMLGESKADRLFAARGEDVDPEQLWAWWQAVRSG